MTIRSAANTWRKRALKPPRTPTIPGPPSRNGSTNYLSSWRDDCEMANLPTPLPHGVHQRRILRGPLRGRLRMTAIDLYKLRRERDGAGDQRRFAREHAGKYRAADQEVA